MKLHNSVFLTGVLALAAGALASCSSGGNDEPKPETGNSRVITIRTNVVVNTKSNLITELGDGHAMNVWAKQYGSIDAADIVPDIKAVNQGGNWTMTPEVRVTEGNNAFLYAFYPYSTANANPKALPIDLNTQADYLYSGSYVPASYQTNTVTLNMKHAQAMLSFNVKKEGYSGEGHITRISISNNDYIGTKGTINVTNGAITTTERGTVTANVNAVATENGISGALPSVWAIPFNTLNTGVEIKAVLTIDGKEYQCLIPEVAANRGWQMVFHAVLTPNGLAIVPGATEEYELNMQDDQFTNLQGYGVLKFEARSGIFTFPAFTGDNIFGNVSVGTNGLNYTPGGKIELATPGTVVVETWNTTGFSLQSLDGIDKIDISQY